MKKILTPFNLFLMFPSEDDLEGIRPVTVLDTFAANKIDFHEDGLFSTEIFGRIGDEIRDYRYSFIDIRAHIFHPIIYDSLIRYKSLYGGIMSGKEFAIWNPETNDFDRSNAIDGKTGYHFFIKHWMSLKFDDISSRYRKQITDTLNKYQQKPTSDKVIVMPAGIRDVEMEADGRVSKSEVNEFYQRLISISNVIDRQALKNNPEFLDNSRYSLQITFNNLFDYLLDLIDGKKKLVPGKFMSRRVAYGNRNIITAMGPTIKEIGAAGNVTINHTQIGLFHVLKGLAPIVKFALREKFLNKIFYRTDQVVELVNKNTLQLEEVKLSRKVFDNWSSDEGVERLIEKFRPDNGRHDAILINDHFLSLIYKGKDNTFKIIRDIRELPSGLSKDNVYPITWTEFLYLSIYERINKYPVWTCRYPVAGNGSNYPSFTYVRTTVRANPRIELDDNWALRDSSDFTAWQFPVYGEAFVNSTIPHGCQVAGLVADFDGDMVSTNFTMTDEAIRETLDYFKSRRAYIGTDGKLTRSVFSMSISLVKHNLLRR